MDWSHLQHRIPYEKNFRWRGGQVSRVEAFTDAVFAVSVTLLVVSTQVPSSAEQLFTLMKAFPAFAVSFALVLLAWYFHFIHFRRYGVEDGATLLLNIVLLFVVLFYVYPLKFMMAFLQEWVTNDIEAAAVTFGVDEVTVGWLLTVYGVGFVLMYVILALMAAHALRLRHELELNEVEVVMTRSLINTHLIQVAVGVVSIAMALFLPSPNKGYAGFAYLLLPILHPLHGVIATRQEKAALQQMTAAAAGDARGEGTDEKTSADTSSPAVGAAPMPAAAALTSDEGTVAATEDNAGEVTDNKREDAAGVSEDATAASEG